MANIGEIGFKRYWVGGNTLQEEKANHFCGFTTLTNVSVTALLHRASAGLCNTGNM